MQVAALPEVGLLSSSLDSTLKLADPARGKVNCTVSLHHQVWAPACCAACMRPGFLPAWGGKACPLPSSRHLTPAPKSHFTNSTNLEILC